MFWEDSRGTMKLYQNFCAKFFYNDVIIKIESKSIGTGNWYKKLFTFMRNGRPLFRFRVIHVLGGYNSDDGIDLDNDDEVTNYECENG